MKRPFKGIVMSPFAISGALVAALSGAPASLENMVVVGSRLPRPVADVAGAVTVIDQQQMQQRLLTDIYAVMRHEVGLSAESNGTRFNPTSFNVRGIGGNRVKLLVDDVPVADDFSVGSYSASGRTLVEPEFLQRLEVLRGAASSLYGSDAIGGVVALYTLGPDDYLHRSEGDHYFGLQAQANGSNDGLLLNIAGARTFGQAAASVAISQRRFDAFDNQSALPNAKDDVQDTKRDSLLTGVQWGSADRVLWELRADHTDQQTDTDIQSFLGYERFATTTELLGDDRYQRSRITLRADVGGQVLDQNRFAFSWQDNAIEQLSLETRQTADSHIRNERLFRYTQQSWFGGWIGEKLLVGEQVDHRLVFGADLGQRQLRERRDATQFDLIANTQTSTILSEQFPLRDFPITDITEIGLYIQDEITIGDAWTLMPALRVDHYQADAVAERNPVINPPSSAPVDIDETSVSPKFGVIYDMTDSQQWYAHYSHGYRPPPFDDVNLQLNIPAFRIRAVPNPDLRSETSDNLEWGYRYDGAHTQLDLGLFYARYEDFIQSRVPVGVDTNGFLLFQSRNIDEARIHGIEARIQHQWDASDAGAQWFVQGGAFYADGENTDNGDALLSLDPPHVTAGLGWRNPNETLQLRLLGTAYQGVEESSFDVEQYQPGGYAVFDLHADWQISNHVTVNAGVFNVADKKYWHWQSVRGIESDNPLREVLSAPGRSVAVSLRLDF